MKTEITNALANLDQSAHLFDLPDAEFQTGGAITNACRIAGYDDSGNYIVDSLNAWRMTVAEFADIITANI